MIQRGLGEAIDLALGQQFKIVKGKYEDDGSNLRVKTSKPGLVQIIKVSQVLHELKGFSYKAA